MKTLELLNRDLNLSNHSFVMLDDRASAKQRISNRLSLYLGEFSLESSSGIDWFSLKGIGITEREIETTLRRELLKDPEISGVPTIEVILVNSNEKVLIYSKPLRTVIINVFVSTIYGDLRLSV